MPILIKNIDWNQTKSTVTVKVPLKGAHQSKTDIFYSKSYIKASYEQYFFEVFLLHPINPKSSNCTVTASYILFELIKCEPQIWESLELDISKAEKQQLKKHCIEEGHKKLQEEHADHLNAKSELKRLAVREQMALDAKQREFIEDVKNDERNNALKQMDIWKKNHQRQKVANKCKVKGYRIREEVQPSAPAKPQVPPPRTSRIVNVSFTPREFPTPCRESRLEEENEWLRKQAEARRSVGFLSEDLRPEEHNPQFLKSKGDEFLKSRNFLAAISAYSFGIKLSDKFPDLYVGRAEAHLALGEFVQNLVISIFIENF
jgi:dyslexia susceptibility 1 candidate gene 1 protein